MLDLDGLHLDVKLFYVYTKHPYKFELLVFDSLQSLSIRPLYTDLTSNGWRPDLPFSYYSNRVHVETKSPFKNLVTRLFITILIKVQVNHYGRYLNLTSSPRIPDPSVVVTYSDGSFERVETLRD